MRIIRSGLGKKREFTALYHVTCKVCNCLFEALEGESDRLIGNAEPGISLLEFICPECGSTVHTNVDLWHSKIEVLSQEAMDVILDNVPSKETSETTKTDLSEILFKNFLKGSRR